MNESKRVPAGFYSLRATELAPALLGKLLCRKTENGIIKLRITETECYYGESDSACHASRGKTERTKILYLPGGYAYIYLCYGMHNLFNIVSGLTDFPEAVLIRGAGSLTGPARLTKAMGIDRTLNGESMITSSLLWLEEDGCIPVYTTAKRVGIDYAKPEDRDRLWRFIVQEGNC